MQNDTAYIIDYSNLKNGLIKYQNNFLNERNLKEFYNNKFYGIPICIPKGIKYFDYSKSIFFKIDKIKFAKKIFLTSNLNYIGIKKYFRYGNIFASKVKLKKKYNKIYNKISYHNRKIQKKINNLKNKNICSMQIRNVPHLGHEEIFKYLLNKYRSLVINPIIGVKKRGDFSDEILNLAFKYICKKYKNIHYFPIYSNFFYGGPREALHHLNIREMLGFKSFYIGRDHAGAENLYHPQDAINYAKKFKKKNIITPEVLKGSYYCKSCKNVVIKGLCNHRNMENISGSTFRSKIKNKKIYKFADTKLQFKIHESKIKLFY